MVLFFQLMTQYFYSLELKMGRRLWRKGRREFLDMGWASEISPPVLWSWNQGLTIRLKLTIQPAAQPGLGSYPLRPNPVFSHSLHICFQLHHTLEHTHPYECMCACTHIHTHTYTPMHTYSLLSTGTTNFSHCIWLNLKLWQETRINSLLKDEQKIKTPTNWILHNPELIAISPLLIFTNSLFVPLKCISRKHAEMLLFFLLMSFHFTHGLPFHQIEIWLISSPNSCNTIVYIIHTVFSVPGLMWLE